MELRFTWDPAKAQRNLRVHGVSFETAREIFSDPGQVVFENYHIEDQGEQRYTIVGMTRGWNLLVVIYVSRDRDGAEVIHLISARKADTYERKIYATSLHA